jgi:DNA-directed RNA polymerase subunit RPC12/RpoP
MTWSDIKKSIVDDLTSRNLKDLNRRLGALDKIETIMQQYYPSYIGKPDELKAIGKDKFKRNISDKKGKGLNNAEISVINEIYYRVSPEQYLRPEARDTSSLYNSKNIKCPNCGILLFISDELANEKYLKCLICGKDFQNPLNHKSTNFSTGRIVVGILVSIIILISLFSLGEENNSSPSDTEAYVKAMRFVKEQLISPSSAKFPNWDYQIFQSGDLRWTIKSYVDAQNGFGALIRQNYTIIVRYDNERKAWYYESLDLY